MKKFFVTLLLVLILGMAGYVVVLGQRYTAQKESNTVDYSAADICDFFDFFDGVSHCVSFVMGFGGILAKFYPRFVNEILV